MGTLLQDIHYGLRMLRKSPGFTLIAVITLALGIGANTALFSVVNGVLINPLPFPHPEQLVTLHESKPNFDQGSISYPNFLDWQKDNHTFAAMAIYRNYSFNLTGAGEAQQVSGEFISSDFFRLLDVKTRVGRTFLPGEDRIGAAPVALISAGLWERTFSSAPDILGKTITLDGRNYAVVGVIPTSFHLQIPSFRERQVYVPIGQWSNSLLPTRASGLGIHGIGRLKPGVTIEQARADMEAVAHNLAVAYPQENKGIGATTIPLKQQMVGDVKPFLLVLLGSVGFVLLIACVNVANLLLARSTSRNREFAIRVAVGAGQGRIVRQLLTESILLAIAGGSLGILLGMWGLRAALGVLPTTLPRAEEIALDGRVLLFTVALTMFAGILSGVAPALLKTSRLDLHNTLKEGGRGFAGGRHRTQSALVVVEMALALVLLIGSGLMVRSLARLWRVDPGFNSHNLTTFNVSLPPSMIKASPDAIRAGLRQLEQKLASVPGVQAAALTLDGIPMANDDEQLFWIEGQAKPANVNDMNWTIDYVVGPDYLKTMGIPLLQGRFFTLRDDEHAPRVAVVDDVFARKFFPGQSPIGKRLNIRNGEVQVEIVGVSGHVKQWGLDTDDTYPLRAEMYLPYAQMPDDYIVMAPAGVGVMARSSGPAVLDSIRHASREMSSEQVISGVQTMDDIIAQSLATRRFSMILLGVFAALALTLASIGIYGVISYVVGERTREMGVRIALGAEPADILRLILGRGGKLAAIGVAAGFIAALGLTRLMSSLLYGVAATDPLTFIAVGALLAAVALAACYIPAHRATQVDPVIALRYE